MELRRQASRSSAGTNHGGEQAIVKELSRHESGSSTDNNQGAEQGLITQLRGANPVGQQAQITWLSSP